MRAVLFDFDYTLGDTTEGILACLRFGLERLGFPPAPREEMRMTIGLSLSDTLERLTGCADPGVCLEFARLFMEKADEVMVASASLYPGALPLLRALRDKGIATAIVTSKGSFRIEAILEKFGASELVDVIVGSDMVEREKPHPEALLRALELLHIGAEDAIYIGDSAVDAACARSAGVAFVGVTTGTTTAEELAGFPHILIVPGLTELQRLPAL